jgi:hypothetical protein
MGYPPLVHQSIGLLSLIGGLFGMFTVAIIGIVLFITGVYRYTLMMTGNRNVAGYASFAVYSSSFVETIFLGNYPVSLSFATALYA